MRHTTASQLFRAEAARLPQHRMHVMARMKVCLYLHGRYRTSLRHARLVARALASEDDKLVFMEPSQQTQ